MSHKKTSKQTPPKSQLKSYINNGLAAKMNQQQTKRTKKQPANIHQPKLQQRISVVRFHKEQSPRFSSFFGNFPFPTTLARISHKIFFSNCSSDLACPACLISFRVHQILYTTEPKASLQRIALRDCSTNHSNPKLKYPTIL